MTPDRARHLAEAVLADQGWNVYRLALGAGPALVAMNGGAEPVVVAVASASEPRGGTGPYPRLDRAAGCHALASVTAAGRVRFYTPSKRRRGRVQLAAALSGRQARFPAPGRGAGSGDGLTARSGALPAG